ncbi:hypothetical protein BDR26DRAFT_803613 [Obelidium mucronatum]|nr:hypothetical protein BDR26DRAFT_803613 [Obelidium mucronatum]
MPTNHLPINSTDPVCHGSDFKSQENPGSSTVTAPGQEPKSSRFASFSEFLIHSLKGGFRSYALSFALRGGVSCVVSLVKVLKGRATLSHSFKQLFNPSVFRFANMIGSFSFFFRLISYVIRYWQRSLPLFLVGEERRIPFIAGCISGLSVLFETYENRVAVMQQFGLRALQAVYNGLESRNLYSFPHGDSLLFMIACGSIMYGYTMQPDTIPPEYYNWIVQTARVSKEALSLSRQNNRAHESRKIPPIAFSQIESCINKNSGPNALTALSGAASYYSENVDARGILPIVPCEVIHPGNTHCISYNISLIWKVLIGIAPVYTALNFVPMVLLKTRQLREKPGELVSKGIWNTLVSSSFLASYVGVYMAGICIVRNLVRSGVLERDHKFWYYFLGCLASGSSIFLEKKHRRAELAIYCLPKGLQSLFLVLQKRQWVFHVPGSETALCCLSMGVLMSFYQCESKAMSPFVVKIFDKVLGDL